MSDDLRSPAARPVDDEVSEQDERETEAIDEEISDDPVVEEFVEEDGATYDPAAQIPSETER